MKQQIIDAVEAAFKVAEAYYNRTFTRPKNILFREKGATVGGYCNYGLSELMFHLGYCEQNPSEYIRVVIPHEVAHWIDREYYGFQTHESGRRISHGRTWKYIMTRVYKLPANRCLDKDTYDFEEVRERKRRQTSQYKYVCACSGRSHNISSIIHNRIMKGKTYRCTVCRSKINIWQPTQEEQVDILKQRIAALQQEMEQL